MSTFLPPLVAPQPRFSIGGRAASLALLRSRIAPVPGLSVIDEAAARTGEPPWRVSAC